MNDSTVGTAFRSRVVDHIVNYLSAGGVRYLFGVDGANIEERYDVAHLHWQRLRLSWSNTELFCRSPLAECFISYHLIPFLGEQLILFPVIFFVTSHFLSISFNLLLFY